MIYNAFGLRWQLPFLCPELGEPITETIDEKADVVVRLGPVPETLRAHTPAGPFQQVEGERTLFQFPDVARYLVAHGNEITIDPVNGAEQKQLRLFLLGTAAALLLLQRGGILPLHASGVRTPQGAILFSGHSGYGKSTLLGAFHARGYEMLTDDLAAIRLDENGRPRVEPAFPQIKLWADSAEQLQQETKGLDRVRPGLEKFAVLTGDRLSTAPAPLHTVYFLTIDNNSSQVRLETLRDARKFNALLDHTWQKLVLKRMGRHKAHFRQVVAVANQVRIKRLYRPERPFLLDELVDRIIADFTRNEDDE